ncbi:MAG: DNA-binding response regulator [Bacteroidetes bacterium]|nr:MAG: DNA-binding response regulator [Bacteroidota bacterium]
MTETIKAIIIDDEERARRLLSTTLTDHCSEIEVLAQCENVPEGVLAINRLKPDVVFLDIEMPEYTGFELLDFFREVDFEIIFVTAYSEYAIQAFEVSAIDYILKPIRIDKLETAVERLKSKLSSTTMFDRLETLKTNLASDYIEKIAVPVSDGLIFIKVNEISYIEADGSYAKLQLINGSNMLISKNLKFFKDLLKNQNHFYRVHRSHLLNMHTIQKYNRHESLVILENGTKIKVARDHKSSFETALKDLHSDS